jgi:hypothetical protein
LNKTRILLLFYSPNSSNYASKIFAQSADMPHRGITGAYVQSSSPTRTGSKVSFQKGSWCFYLFSDTCTFERNHFSDAFHFAHHGLV